MTIEEIKRETMLQQPIEDISNANRHGGDLHWARKRFGRKRFLDLSVNINPLGPSLRMWMRMIRSLVRVREYPEPYSKTAQQIIACFFGVTADSIALGNGAAELIAALPHVLPVKRCIILEPTFAEYRRAFDGAGIPVLRIGLTPEFQIPLSAVKANLGADDILFICQPNNPTGNLVMESELSQLVDWVTDREAWLVVDESFLWFCGDIRELSIIRKVKNYPRLIILNSITKIGAIPGLRMGFIGAQPSVIQAIQNELTQWNVNIVAQTLLADVLKEKFLYATRKFLTKEKSWLNDKLSTIHELEIFPWEANFYLVRLKTAKISGPDLLRKLGEKGILVRDCRNFCGLNENYFRVAVGRRSQNRRLIQTIKEILHNG